MYVYLVAEVRAPIHIQHNQLRLTSVISSFGKKESHGCSSMQIFTEKGDDDDDNDEMLPAAS